MAWHKTYPVPNEVVDYWMRELESGSAFMVFSLVIRNTIGWSDERTMSERKEMDWISISQFQAKTGLSRKAISPAIQRCVDTGAFRVFDIHGTLLDTPEKRKGKFRLCFRPHPALFHTSEKNAQVLINTREENALTLRRKVAALARKTRYT
ncbi:MAG: hypothetical protein FD123_390 [Bacteroidetes bacterium]|nr:MAG: hypothetical protein FD123_390 [Bacteroidota bacterium]